MFLCAGMKAERWIATDLEGVDPLDPLDPGQDRVRHGNRLQSTERGLKGGLDLVVKGISQ
jgi:hypothetical protein